MPNAVPIRISVGYSQENCQECGSVFWVNAAAMKYKRDNGGKYWCPGCGTSWVFRDTTAARLQRQLDAERESKRFVQRRLDEETRSHAATRGYLTRQKRRSRAGVCPCCNRTFKQLSRHMKSQHPEYGE